MGERRGVVRVVDGRKEEDGDEGLKDGDGDGDDESGVSSTSSSRFHEKRERNRGSLAGDEMSSIFCG